MHETPDHEKEKTLLERKEEITIPVIHEELEVRKEVVETGRVLIQKTVETEEFKMDVPLRSRKIEVTRIPKNEEVSTYPNVRTEGSKTIISVVKEVAVVVKKLMLVEEIHIEQSDVIDTQTVYETLRTEHFDIDRQKTDPSNNQ